jgi:hypothetical protein
MLRRVAALLGAFVLGCCASASATNGIPRPAHTVIIIEENKTLAQIIGSGDAPYLDTVSKNGMLFTSAFGVRHPSQPNYFALFAGITNANGDGCPAAGIPRDAPNLASELIGANYTFAAYSEALPSVGFLGCSAGTYAQKHAPWTHFSNIAQSLHRPLDDLTSFEKLPTVTFIVPDVDDDMHDGTIKEGDDWAEAHLAPLLKWAATHDTLVIFTWDEGFDSRNSIPTIFIGPMVRAGRYTRRIDHFNVLRTIEDMYGLKPTGGAAEVPAITGIWR